MINRSVLNRTVLATTMVISIVFHSLILWSIGLQVNQPKTSTPSTMVSAKQSERVVPLLSERELNKILKRPSIEEKKTPPRKKK